MTQVKLTFDRKGDNFLGVAEIPTRRGPLVFKTLIPMTEVRQQIKDWLADQPTVGADPLVLARMPGIEHKVATIRAKRRLGTAIRIRFGGRVRPYEVSGSAGHAYQLARVAGRRGDIGGIGKVFKKVGKAVGKAGKAVGKTAYKGTKAVVKNPITGALLTVVPGGPQAKAILDAARQGSPGAQQAINDINTLANGGDVQAIQSRDALNAAKGGISPLMIAGIGAAVVGAVMLAKK